MDEKTYLGVELSEIELFLKGGSEPGSVRHEHVKAAL
jgi:hypothetical protein